MGNSIPLMVQWQHTYGDVGERRSIRFEAYSFSFFESQKKIAF